MSTPVAAPPAAAASPAPALPALSQPAPSFVTQALIGRDFRTVGLADYAGQWVLLFFYPLDFTFVCPTELMALNERYEDFIARRCQVLACSTDSVYAHLGWVKAEPRLSALRYPLLSDLSHDIARRYGVLVAEAGVALRGSFLIDPSGRLRWLSIHDLNTGRSVAEILRVLFALQTDRPCPCDWQPGQPMLNPE
jgi:peroxiredoxin (alkyl hydroperoxide reductase subunit C)